MITKGCFITFEGGEGSGKTTLIEGIAEVLFSQRVSFIKTREPGSTHFGEEIRNLLLSHSKDEMSSYTELCLYLAARAQHIKEVILPALQEKKVVLCDRFNDSTIAYQGYGRNLGVSEVEKFCDFVCEKLKPDLTLYLDIHPELGLKRVKKTTKRGYDRIESEDISFHQKVREGFYILAKKEPDRFIMIDAENPKENVLQIALKHIENKLRSLGLDL